MVERIRYEIGAVNKTKQAFSGVRRGLGGMQRAAMSLKNVFVGMLAIGGITGIVRSFNTVISRLDTIAKQADKLGLTVEALQEFRFAAELSGVALRTFDMAFQRFTRRSAEAAIGTGEAKDALKQLGFTLDDLRSKNPAELFQQAADALANTEDAAERLRLAFKLFDSEGVAVVNMVTNLRALRQEARDLGIVLSEDMVRGAVRMKDEMTRAIAVISTAWARFVISFVNGMDIIFGVIPNTVEEQLGERIAALKKLQDQIAKLASSDDQLTAASRKTRIAALSADASPIHEEIRVLSELIEARKKAKIFGADLGGDGAGRPSAVTKAGFTFGDALDQLSREANALELRINLIGRTTREQATLRAETEIFNKLQRENISLTDEQRLVIKEFADDVGFLAEMEETARLAFEETNKAIEDQGGALDRATAGIDRLGESFINMAISGQTSFKDMAASILRDFIRMEARMLTSKLFSGGSGGGGSGGGGFFSKLLGAIGFGVSAFAGSAGSGNFGTSATGTSPFASFAHGGPVRGGEPIKVHAGEVFIPPQDGRILNASQANRMDRGGGGGQGNVFYIDATGADQAAIARLETALFETVGPGRIESRAVAGVIAARRKNPRMFGGA